MPLLQTVSSRVSLVPALGAFFGTTSTAVSHFEKTNSQGKIPPKQQLFMFSNKLVSTSLLLHESLHPS